MSKPNKPATQAKPTAPSAAGADGVVRTPPATAMYLVGGTPILRDGKRFEPGSTIELRPDQAARLGLSLAKAAEPPQPAA